ncbi:MauE/DoxX family redox-associated membrane protein [Cohnella sp. GCM10012308]|uniref:MauE/DoxX family redox-associated membrane protein n=1 Tax=Cohnella sp. GCM10012308 TaxID=3317329 RepID=UPI003608CA51
MHWENETAWLCDFAMAVVFAASAYGKGQAMTDMRLEMMAYKLLPARLVPAAAWSVLALEWALAAAFAAGGKLEGIKEPAAIVVLLGMTWLSRRRNRTAGGKDRARETDGCGCFGANHPLGKRPMLRNAIFVAIAVAGWMTERPAASGAGLAAFAFAVASAVWLLEARKLQKEIGQGRNGEGRTGGGHVSES